MRFDLLPYQHPFNLLLQVRALKPIRLIISMFNPENDALFIHRRVKLNGSKQFLFKLPFASDKVRVEILCKDLPLGDAHFIIENIKIQRDTKCPVELSERDSRFIKFAKWFAMDLKSLSAGEKGTIYQSDEFTIMLMDKILEQGKEVSTPARIGKDSGIIQVSKSKVIHYSVPMLMVMLLHEFAHRFKNPEYGRDTGNELSADLIAVNIALNIGFDAGEVLRCFKAVFQTKDTAENRKRWKAILKLVGWFKQTESKRCNTTKQKSHEKRS